MSTNNVILSRARGQKRPTLNMIAKACGYSISTVSAVLNQRADCWASDDTRSRVVQTARQLGYRPNIVARSLRGGQTWTLGLLTAALNVEVSSSKVQAFESASRDAGYTAMMVFSPNDDPSVEDLLITRLLDRSVDGLAVYPTESGKHTELRRAIQLGVPVVTHDGHGRAELPCDDVSMDYYKAGQMQAEYLISLGCRRLVQVNTTPSCFTKDQLRRGFLDAVADAGLPRPMLWDITQPPDAGSILREDLCRQLAELLRLHRGRIDAVAAYDLVATGVIRAAHELGIAVPRELSVIGSDGTYTASNCYIPLTTVAQPVGQIGSELFALLRRRIEQRDLPVPIKRLRLAPSLVVRASTAAVVSGKGV